MADYDLVVAGGSVVTPSDVFQAAIGIAAGRIAAIGIGLTGARTLDAGGLVVLPGGVDSHCHIEQLQQGGGVDEETWTTGSTSATGTSRPSSAESEVTPASRIPHGTIRSNQVLSGSQFRAKPCIVTPLATRIPIAAILRSSPR